MSEPLQNLLITVLLAVIPILTTQITKYLDSKTKQVKEITKDEEINKYIDYANEAIKQVVLSVKQTFVDTLKKQDAFSEERQKEAFEKAKSQILMILTKESKEALQLAYEDIDIWLNTKIESLIQEKKKV